MMVKRVYFCKLYEKIIFFIIYIQKKIIKENKNNKSYQNLIRIFLYIVKR